ncbi:MAG: hypothetical protein IJM30_04975 [Thermoguttaceae bacterium]|nr:hypothetical protein [Thermoguttaceae bacterium]
MKKKLIAFVLSFFWAISAFGDNPASPIAGLDDSLNPDDKIVSYETTADKARLFRKEFLAFDREENFDTNLGSARLIIDPSKTYQKVDGFGAAITGSTAFNLFKMAPEKREALLTETFSVEKGLGYSYVRVSIGCSDFSLSEFTCCDKPGIENFALAAEDLEFVIPALKEILAINPDLKIVASPWTCPRWMKVKDLESLEPFESWTSGRLNPKYYEDYALYFAKYLRAMGERGVKIDAITMQNEPLNRGNSASLFMTWQEQREFVKVLGPKLRDEGIDVEIWAFDHNFNYDSNKPECRDQWGYPLHIYEDEEAARYLTGAAYHAYGGSVEEMRRVRDARPDKALYFTEQSIGDWGYSFGGDLMWFTREVGIGVMNCDCRAIIVWNFMLDDKRGPNRPGGCQSCFGAVNISTPDYETVVRYSHFYEIGHFSKVVRTGAVRVDLALENAAPGIRACAFRNPDGLFGLVAQNDSDEARTVEVVCDGKTFRVELRPKSVRSLRWK